MKIENRTIQLIYQTVYCTLGMIGCVASLGIFEDINTMRWDFYVHFTNISNFLCVSIMFAALIQTAKKKENSCVAISPLLKFIGMLSILLTFIVFNFILAGAADRDPQRNWRIGSLCFHVILPIMYVADWFLFYERKKIKWFYPLVSAVFPLGYIILMLLQAVILKFDTSIHIPGTDTPLIYPYFFINIENLGVYGVATWIMILFVAFFLVGFMFLWIDKLGQNKSKI